MKILIALAAVALTAVLMVTAALASGIIVSSERGPGDNGPNIEDERTNDDLDRNPGDEPGDGRDINDMDGERKVVEAPIDVIRIDVMESYPEQYAVHIVSGLPSGCAQFHDLVVERDGDTIHITVTNTMPADDGVACTMIYGMKEHNVNLGSDFVSGETYTVIVNGETETFVAQ